MPFILFVTRYWERIRHFDVKLRNFPFLGEGSMFILRELLYQPALYLEFFCIWSSIPGNTQRHRYLNSDPPTHFIYFQSTIKDIGLPWILQLCSFWISDLQTPVNLLSVLETMPFLGSLKTESNLTFQDGLNPKKRVAILRL